MCEGGVWRERPQWEEDERCDNGPGPQQGRCRAIAHECMNRAPGVAFCDAMEKRRV
jgi:hypothetical protein